MIRAALILLCLAAPAAAPEFTWRACQTDAQCEEMTEIACANGDAAACEPLERQHRAACEATPDHDDCATFKDEEA